MHDKTDLVTLRTDSSYGGTACCIGSMSQYKPWPTLPLFAKAAPEHDWAT